MKIRVGHLYPEYLNIYADRGNIAVLADAGAGARASSSRCWRSGSASRCRRRSTSSTSAAARIASRRSSRPTSPARPARSREAVDGGAAFLAVCGGYQLLGRFYRDRRGAEIPGHRAAAAAHGRRRAPHDRRRPARLRLGRRDARGLREPRRPDDPRRGRRAARPGRVRASATTASRGFEGCRAGRVYGTYLHGPLLPRNPWFADRLLADALAHATAGGSSSRRSTTGSRREAHAVSRRASARRWQGGRSW